MIAPIQKEYKGKILNNFVFSFILKYIKLKNKKYIDLK